MSATLPMLPGVPVLLGEDHNTTGCAEPDSAQPASATVQALLDRRREFLRFIERRVDCTALSEDILQNAYLRALERSSEVRNSESSTAWFYRILRNAVIDFYRHRSVEDRALAQWAKELETEVQPNDFTRDIVCRCIQKVLPALKASYADILRSVDLDETPLSAFAAAQGITPANATVRIHRARKALKQALIVLCGCCTLHGCVNCSCAR